MLDSFDIIPVFSCFVKGKGENIFRHYLTYITKKVVFWRILWYNSKKQRHFAHKEDPYGYTQKFPFRFQRLQP